ncbi:MAG: MBL fold metallo-hydrolase [Oligoflexia bacterium]|nr:MBL fold metallo-hydrolase [Oligoflexia bacterium]
MSASSVTILGCGTSTGVPVLGCACGVCSSPHPRNKRYRTSAVVRLWNGKNIVIDTSADFRSQALSFGLDRVDAVLYTHAHADHIMGMDDLRGYNFSHQHSIPCFSDATTLATLRRTFSYIFEPDPTYEGGMLPQLTLHEIKAYLKFELCGTEVMPLALQHGKLSVLGFRFGDFAYCTDCKSIPESSMQTLQGVKTLVLDALRYETHRTHLTIPESIEIARKIGAQQTYFVHMTHTVDYETVSKNLPPGIALAYDGLTFEFSA